MPGEHVFIDESTQKNYLVVCSVMPSGSVTEARKAMKSLLLPGQRSLHMKDEGKDGRQRQIVRVITNLAPRVTIYCAKPSEYRAGHTGARDACLQRAAARAVQEGVAVMRLDRNDTYVKRDRRSIIEGSSSTGARRVPFQYDHMARTEEPLLWIPDAIGWAYARGGRHRASVSGLIAVTHL